MGRDDVAFEFDVALSYAGEDRRYVEDVATYLSEHGIRVFYDMDQAVAMWGEDLFEFLDAVYRLRSRYAVVFVSRYYVAKNWPTHERRSVQARALEDGEVYLLPVHLDDAILPGLRPTVHYMDGAKLTPHELGANILEKLGYDSRAVGSAYVPGIPYNPHEIQELLGHRPDYWEYMLYVGVVRQRMNAIEEKYRDHEMGFAPRNEKYVSRDEMIWLRQSYHECHTRYLCIVHDDNPFGFPCKGTWDSGERFG